MINDWKEIKVGPQKWKYRYEYFRRNKPFKGNIKKIKADQYAIKSSTNTYNLITRGRRY